MQKRIYNLIGILSVLLGLTLVVRTADASVLSVQPIKEKVLLDDTFLVDVHLSSEGEVVNAVETSITYPENLLELVKVSTGNSFLSLWIVDPTESATPGRVDLVGGVPHGSYVQDGLLVRLMFRARALGDAEIRFTGTSSSVRKADGTGDPTPLRFSAGAFTIDLPSEYAIGITSPTHPNQDLWYQETTFTAAWKPRPDAVYSYTLTRNPEEFPDDLAEESQAEATFADLTDGIYYFMLLEKIPTFDDWRMVARRRVQVDTMPPEPFDAIIAREPDILAGAYALLFAPSDALSGIAAVDVLEDSLTSTGASSPFRLHDQEVSEVVRVKAVDEAGNTREVEARMVLRLPLSLVETSPALTSLWLALGLIVSSGVLVFFQRRLR